MMSTGLSQALLADESTPRGFAWPETPSLNFYGAPGVIDMPSAEALPDAQFTSSVSWFAGQFRANLQVQALPWMT
ncbi:MAG: YjbH domain-containing protein, partial [Tritonibacter mobilis]|nr:YjbH domain-containing protein [Tritonibacter mobilis]